MTIYTRKNVPTLIMSKKAQEASCKGPPIGNESNCMELSEPSPTQGNLEFKG